MCACIMMIMKCAFLHCLLSLNGYFQKDKVDSHLPSDSIFYKFGEHGLISFSDYMFLLVVLSSKCNLSCLSLLSVKLACISISSVSR